MKKIISLGILIIVIILLLLAKYSNIDPDNITNHKNSYHSINSLFDDMNYDQTSSDIILFDNFYDKDISDWDINYQNSKGWAYDFKDSTGIIVKDIINESFSKDLYGPWANVILNKMIPEKDSLTFVSKISWDSFSEETAMQHIYFSFKDEKNKEIFFFGYNDPYISYKGGILTKFCDTDYYWHKKRELNLKGNCLLKMIKQGNRIKLFYNDELLNASTIKSSIKYVNIIFGFFPSINYKDSDLKSTFGTLCVEYINISEYMNH
ncbi:MAG: hypothetical protein JXR69_08095 [Candidatus Delongbacteria bacterium]|nr:hypothetical protein [Candidatus Delongbacteria bacterium]